MKKIITTLLILTSVNLYSQKGISVKLTKSNLWIGTPANYQAGLGVMKSIGTKRISFAIGAEYLLKKYSAADKPLQAIPLFAQGTIRIKFAYILARAGYQFNLSKTGTIGYHPAVGQYSYNHKGPIIDIGLGMNLFRIRKKAIFLEVPIRFIKESYSDKFITKKTITPDAMISLGIKF